MHHIQLDRKVWIPLVRMDPGEAYRLSGAVCGEAPEESVVILHYCDFTGTSGGRIMSDPLYVSIDGDPLFEDQATGGVFTLHHLVERFRSAGCPLSHGEWQALLVARVGETVSVRRGSSFFNFLAVEPGNLPPQEYIEQIGIQRWGTAGFKVAVWTDRDQQWERICRTRSRAVSLGNVVSLPGSVGALLRNRGFRPV